MNNLPEFYRDRCKRFSNNYLFGNTITYGETLRLAYGRAAFLQAQGCKKGDVVGLLASNSPEWCVSFMAITAIGALALPLDTTLKAEQYSRMLAAASARACFVSDGFIDRISTVPAFRVDFSDSMADEDSYIQPALSAGDIASLLFTSGTTGAPKIVALTHGNVMHIAIVCTELEEYTEKDVTLSILPLFHVYAFESNFMAPLVTGSSIVFQPSLKGPDIIKSLADNDITIFPAAPQMWELFFDAITQKIRAQSIMKYRLFMFLLNAAPLLRAIGLSSVLDRVFEPVHAVFGKSMRFFISGGAPLKRKYFEYYRRMGFYIMEGYGLTETTGPIAIPYYKNAIAGSVGAPIRGNEVKVKNINADGIGEIWLRGEAVMAGYYNNDEANRRAFDANGFFNTGDLGRVDARGNIFLTGRMKNVIVLDSGKNVYPEELELYFKQSPAISEIAVFGRKIDGRETVFAVIVPASKTRESFAALRGEIASLNRGLPPYRWLRRYAVSFDPLPKNSTRKVLVDQVIARLDRGLYQTAEDTAPVPENTLAGTSAREEAIIAVLRKKLGRDKLYASQGLSDFNIDSLGLIDLIVFLEDNLGVAIDADRFRGMQTLDELVAYLAGCDAGSGARCDESIVNGAITTHARRLPNPVNNFLLMLVQNISRLCWKLTTVHRERLIPDNSIIVANHQSNLDVLWLYSQLPAQKRRNVFAISKKELSFMKYIFPGAPLVFVERNGNVLPALKAGADLLRQGKSLIIFPEGTRTATGEIGEFKNGAAYLAKKLDKNIIPVTINGSFAILPRKKKIPRFFSRSRGSLTVHTPLKPDAFACVEDLTVELHRIIRGGLRAANG